MFKTYFEHKQQAFVVFTLRDLMSSLSHVPKFQRVLDDEHASVLYKSFENMFLSTKCLDLVGEISLGRHDKNDTNYKILDDQHRFSCLKKLFETYPECGDELVQVKIYTGTDDYQYDIYTFVNTNKKVDLCHNADDAIIYGEFGRFLAEEYKEYITFKKVYIPFINPDIVIEELKKRKIATKLNIETPSVLIEYVKEINEYYQTLKPSEWKDLGLHEYQASFQKIESRKKKFMLGLYKHFEWIDRIIQKHEEKLEYRTMNHSFYEKPKPASKALPWQLRQEVWEKRNKNGSKGACYVCNNELNEKNFHASHIVASALGGSNSLDNLEPCCQACNLDMRTMNLNEYRKYYKPSDKPSEDVDSDN